MPQDKSTGALYLDQRQAMGIDFGGVDRGYPPIDKTIAEVLRVVAQNLYITESSLQWAWYDAVALGKSESFKAIRDKLMSKPLIMRA